MLFESLGDLTQEHVSGAIRWGANDDDRSRSKALIHLSLGQILVQLLRTKLGIPSHFGASRNRSRARGGVIGRGEEEELASVPVVGDVFTWVVDNGRLFGLPIASTV